MTIPTPPVGARVRHTTTYPDGTAVTVEGSVAPNANHNQTAEPYLLIGGELLVGYLVDRPGAYAVALEVLEPPSPPEPPNGTVYGNGMAVWFRCDPDDPGDEDETGLWWCSGSHPAYRWADVGPIVKLPGWRRLIPDPVDDAPALPWRDRGDEIEASDTEDDEAPVWITIQRGWRTRSEATWIAAAILRAARQARQS